MRILPFDLSNEQSPPSVFGGNEGEHLETQLQVTLPDRMISSENNVIDKYKFIFETGFGEKIESDFILPSQLQDNVITISLWKQLMVRGNLKFCVGSYSLDNADINANGDTVEVIKLGKTVFCTLNIKPSSNGTNTPISSPEEVAEALTAADQAIAARDVALNKVISNAEVNGLGHLVLTYADNTTVDAGYVKGDKGDRGDKGDTGEVDQAEFDILQKRFDNLIMASKGIVYNESVNSTSAYTKVIPVGSQKYATIDLIGGKSELVNGIITSGKVDKVISNSKNLLNLSSKYDTSVSAFGGTLYCGKDGGIKGSGTPTGSCGFTGLPNLYLPNGIYTISAKGTFANMSFSIYLRNASGQQLYATSVVSNTQARSFNTADYPTYSYISFEVKRNSNNVEMSGTAYFQLEAGSTPTTYSLYKAPIEKLISTEIQNLDGYGESNPENAAEYNYINFQTNKFIKVGKLVDGNWVTEKGETDISMYSTDDNFVEVEVGGILTFHQQNNTQLSVPSTETFIVKVANAV